MKTKTLPRDVCKVCGRPFKVTQEHQFFCSKKCQKGFDDNYIKELEKQFNYNELKFEREEPY